MCFHLALIKKNHEIEMAYQAVFEEGEAFEPIPHGNGFARIQWPVISNDMPSRIRFFQWGLVPKWVREVEKAKEIQLHTLNARIETVFEKPAFRDAVHNRCLVIVTGFFEWMTVGGKKYPVFFRKKDESIFSLAGIWEQWVHPLHAKTIFSFSILTMSGKGTFEGVNWIPPRIPVVLSKFQEKAWLSEELSMEALSDLAKIDDSLVGCLMDKTFFQNPGL